MPLNIFPKLGTHDHVPPEERKGNRGREGKDREKEKERECYSMRFIDPVWITLTLKKSFLILN